MLVILVSWSIAFLEYCLAVPANRIWHRVYSAAELKVMQEVMTLSVFAAFSGLYLGERLIRRPAEPLRATLKMSACGHTASN